MIEATVNEKIEGIYEQFKDKQDIFTQINEIYQNNKKISELAINILNIINGELLSKVKITNRMKSDNSLLQFNNLEKKLNSNENFKTKNLDDSGSLGSDKNTVLSQEIKTKFEFIKKKAGDDSNKNISPNNNKKEDLFNNMQTNVEKNTGFKFIKSKKSNDNTNGVTDIKEIFPKGNNINIDSNTDTFNTGKSTSIYFFNFIDTIYLNDLNDILGTNINFNTPNEKDMNYSGNYNHNTKMQVTQPMSSIFNNSDLQNSNHNNSNNPYQSKDLFVNGGQSNLRSSAYNAPANFDVLFHPNVLGNSNNTMPCVDNNLLINNSTQNTQTNKNEKDHFDFVSDLLKKK